MLIVKTSSMGDVIHTLPAVQDACNAIPGIEFDWVVEQGFAEIPTWHPAVKSVIPLQFRRWRKTPLQAWKANAWQEFIKTLRAKEYDLIIDAQGLVKSALITRLAKGPRAGFHRLCAREPLASLAYQRTATVEPLEHAVPRIRQLFAQSLGYNIQDQPIDYGVDKTQFSSEEDPRALLFLHGTTWDTKHWPEAYWSELAGIAKQQNYTVKLPWGNEAEHQRAERIAEQHDNVHVLPKLNLHEVACELAKVKAIVAVDTGIGHMAAALAVPTVSLYGPTDAKRTGALGPSQIHLSADFSCAPCLQKSCSFLESSAVKPACFTTLPPKTVWQHLQPLL